VPARVSRPDSLGGRAVCAGGPDGHAMCRRSGSNTTETEEPKQRTKKERRKKIAVKKMKVNETKKEKKLDMAEMPLLLEGGKDPEGCTYILHHIFGGKWPKKRLLNYGTMLVEWGVA
jgi:hypothetical protein